VDRFGAACELDTEADGMKFGHDTLMGAARVISGGLTVAYTRAVSKILLILTLIGAAVTLVIGVLLFFGLA
jgi:ABC-type enterochelin transport system permease subunit